MRHARKALIAALCLLAGVLLGVNAPGGRAAPGASRPPTVITVDTHEPLSIRALTTSTLGWRWSGTVNVYDGTGNPAWKVAEAAKEWGSRTGLHTRVVTTVAAAQIVVYQVNEFTDP